MSEPKTAEVKVVPVESWNLIVGALKAAKARLTPGAAICMVADALRAAGSAPASPRAETGEGLDLERIAKDAAERVHKNGGCVPQLAFAPILFALQDALYTHPASDQSDTERMRAALTNIRGMTDDAAFDINKAGVTIEGAAHLRTLQAIYSASAAALAEKAADK